MHDESPYCSSLLDSDVTAVLVKLVMAHRASSEVLVVAGAARR